MKRVWLAVLCLVLGSARAVAADNSLWKKVPAKDHSRSNPLAENPEAVTAGALVYQEHCAQCHRANADGDAKHPSLRDGQLINRTDGDIEWFLRQGDLRHGMPSWSKLPQIQRWQLIAYLRSLRSD